MAESQSKRGVLISTSRTQHPYRPSRGHRTKPLSKSSTLLVTASTLLLSKSAFAGDDDLLGGSGIFKRPAVTEKTVIELLEQKNWIVVEPDFYDITMKDQYVQLSKKEDAEGFFDDGLTYVFQDNNELKEIQPRHIHFEVYTTTPDVESCDFRFYTVEKVTQEASDAPSAEENDSSNQNDGASSQQEEAKDEEGQESAGQRRLGGKGGGAVSDGDSTSTEAVTRAPAGPNNEYKKVEFSDVALFRLGYFNYAKLNVEQNMLLQFGAEEWYNVDLIINWNDQRVSIYINDEPLKSASFFTQRKEKLQSGNAVSLYGLTPGGVSRFQNLRICHNSVCEEEQGKGFSDLSGAFQAIGSGFSLAVGLSTLLFSLLA